MPFASSQGTTFTFDGDTYSCTNIKVAIQNTTGAGGDNTIDVSTLDLADGSDRLYQDAPLVSANSAVSDEDGNQTTITISFLGDTHPIGGTVGTLVAGEINGTFKCSQVDWEYAVGEVIKGTATFVSANAGS